MIAVLPNLNEVKQDFAEASCGPSVLVKGFTGCSVTSNDLASRTRWVRVLEPVTGCTREL